MKLKSKAVWLMSVVVMMATLLTAIIIIRVADNVISSYAAENVTNTCEKNILEIDGVLVDMESNVQEMYRFVVNQCPEDVLTNPESAQRMIEICDTAFKEKLEYVDYVYSDYFIMNASVYDRTGVFYSKKQNVVTKSGLTPIDDYARDAEEVIWYFKPLEEKKAVWLLARSDKNTPGENLISYVIPIYRDEEFIGVVGMDMQLSVIQSMVAGIEIYDTGYGTLLSADKEFLYHPATEAGIFNENDIDNIEEIKMMALENAGQDGLIKYNVNGQKKYMISRSLESGMVLILSAPASEIDAPRRHLIHIASLVTTISVLITIMIVYFAVKRLLEPIIAIKDAAVKISQGDYSHEMKVETNSSDEIGELTTALNIMTDRMQQYITITESQANTDSMTGIGNKAAFRSRVDDLLANSGDHYGVMIMDVNNLKCINDSFGHNAGDEFIREAVKFLQEVMYGTPIYRVGGDEFALVLGPDTNFEEITQAKVERLFMKHMKAYNKAGTPYDPWGLWLAVGVAVKEPGMKESFSEVYGRADKAMYKNKEKMKKKQMKDMEQTHSSKVTPIRTAK